MIQISQLIFLCFYFCTFPILIRLIQKIESPRRTKIIVDIPLKQLQVRIGQLSVIICRNSLN